MKNLVVNSIMNNITKYYNYDDTKLDEIKYGIESLYLTISKTIIILIGCIILKIVKPLLLLFIFYGIIRLSESVSTTKKDTIDSLIINLKEYE